MKVPFVNYQLYTKICELPPIRPDQDNTNIESTSVIQTTSRSSVVIRNFIGRTLAIHNGKTSKRILIKAEMIGFKLGSFILTKKLGTSIHNSEHNRKRREKVRRKITQRKLRKPTTTKVKKSLKTITKKKR